MKIRKRDDFWDFRTILEDEYVEWSAADFDSVYRECDDGYESNMTHALKAGIPRFAEEYRFREKERRMIEFVQLRRPGRLLDLGCGCGWLSFELQKQLPETRFWGIDVSPYRIANFSEKISEESLGSNMAALLANAETLPFPRDFFDVIVVREAFEHFGDPEKAFDEIARILKPNGFAVISTPVKFMTFFWKTTAVVPTIVKRLLKGKSRAKRRTSLFDRPLPAVWIKKESRRLHFSVVEWRRVILLPHESYLQFIPDWLIRSLIFVAESRLGRFFSSILGLHHVIFLKKNESSKKK